MPMYRIPLFAGIDALATVAALFVWQASLILGVGGDEFFGASLVHPA
jgi:hypothetical protein